MITQEYWYNMINGKGRKPKYCKKNLSQWCFVHPESHVTAFGSNPPVCHAKLKIKLAQLWHNLLNACHKITHRGENIRGRGDGCGSWWAYNQ
jgi:hypothetical protein